MNLPVNFIPPLENGDQLSREEFERRYDATPNLKKAELIEGIVYMTPPLRFESHAKPHSAIMAWLGAYWVATPNLLLGDNATVHLDKDNELQPDAILFLPQALGGRAIITKDDYIEGAPELVVEISASTASYDFHTKRHIYERCGVQECLIWRVYDREIDWFSLQENRYVALKPNEQGLIFSRIFPGLVLAVTDLLVEKYAQVLAELQQGLQSPQHIAFVEQLSNYGN